MKNPHINLKFAMHIFPPNYITWTYFINLSNNSKIEIFSVEGLVNNIKNDFNFAEKRFICEVNKTIEKEYGVMINNNLIEPLDVDRKCKFFINHEVKPCFIRLAGI